MTDGVIVASENGREMEGQGAGGTEERGVIEGGKQGGREKVKGEGWRMDGVREKGGKEDVDRV